MELKTKYEVGESVYFCTTNGLELKEIVRISIFIEDDITIHYRFEEFDFKNLHREEQIIRNQEVMQMQSSCY